MSDQSENEMPLSETVTPENVRQFLLAELDASQQAIEALSDEELTAITGGALSVSPKQDLGRLGRSYSSPAVLQPGHKITPWTGPLPARLQNYIDSFKGLGRRTNG